MELTADILRNKEHNITDTKIISDINNLNLCHCTMTLPNDKFLAKTKSSQWLRPMTNFVNKLFYINKHSDLPDALLYAFYLSGYSKEISPTYFVTRFDERILHYANTIVANISSMIKNNNINDSDFLDNVDHYYSLYKIWLSKDIIRGIDSKLTDFKDALEAYKTLCQRDPKLGFELLGTMKDHMNTIFGTNKMLAIKTFLQLYNEFKKIDPVKIFFWSKVFNVYKENIDHTIILLIAELRRSLLSKVSTVEARKCLYYKIDVDELIKKARNNNIKTEDYANILSILVLYTNNTNNTNNITYEQLSPNNLTNNHVLKNIIEIFENL